MEAEPRAWLTLARTRGVGPRSAARLLARYGSANAAIAALPDHPAAQARGITLPRLEDIEAEIALAAAQGARLLHPGGEGYPAALATIPDPPTVLWARGDVALAAGPCIAVVGARNASANGLRMAARLARELGEAGRVIVSGLARGIDRAAHEAALATGTIAVLAGGVDVIYPPQNAALAAEIAARGLLLSEAPMGEQPTARHFPRRNRIVSGLSDGVVLVEAAARSGSLITARMALEQGREAMAVPGSPLDARTEGCNALIREGAALIRDGADVIEALGRGATLRPPARIGSATRPAVGYAPPPDAPPDGDFTGIVDLLGPEPVEIDALISRSGLDAATLAGALLDLELDGRLERHPGGRVSLLLKQAH
jgi:DNA processing protein